MISGDRVTLNGMVVVMLVVLVEVVIVIVVLVVVLVVVVIKVVVSGTVVVVNVEDVEEVEVVIVVVPWALTLTPIKRTNATIPDKNILQFIVLGITPYVYKSM